MVPQLGKFAAGTVVKHGDSALVSLSLSLSPSLPLPVGSSNCKLISKRLSVVSKALEIISLELFCK